MHYFRLLLVGPHGKSDIGYTITSSLLSQDCMCTFSFYFLKKNPKKRSGIESHALPLFRYGKPKNSNPALNLILLLFVTLVLARIIHLESNPSIQDQKAKATRSFYSIGSILRPKCRRDIMLIRRLALCRSPRLARFNDPRAA